MLVLSRSVGESIHVGSEVQVKILSANRSRVKVGIEAPDAIPIWRSELAPRQNDDRPAMAERERSNGKFSVLVVEDDVGQARLISRILARTADADVNVASSAERAVEWLWGAIEGNLDCRIPDLVLLDLHLPGLSGIDILSKIKSDHRLRRLPVVILTYSEDPVEIRACLDGGANAYITKPSNYERFCESLSDIAKFWGRDSRLPQHVVAS